MIPKISIIIITYNQKTFLEKSLPIIFEQSYKNYEVLVVDSGSADGSFELYKKYSLKVIKYEGPIGKDFNYAMAFNLAVNQAQGDIYVRLSGDAIPIGEHWLSELVNPMIGKKDIAGVYSHQIHSKNSDFHHKFLSFFMFSPYRDYFEKLAPGFMFWGASAAINKKCFEKESFSLEQRRGEDVLWGGKNGKKWL